MSQINIISKWMFKSLRKNNYKFYYGPKNVYFVSYWSLKYQFYQFRPLILYGYVLFSSLMFHDQIDKIKNFKDQSDTSDKKHIL